MKRSGELRLQAPLRIVPVKTKRSQGDHFPISISERQIETRVRSHPMEAAGRIRQAGVKASLWRGGVHDPLMENARRATPEPGLKTHPRIFDETRSE
jgi:hypothetical protein